MFIYIVKYIWFKLLYIIEKMQNIFIGFIGCKKNLIASRVLKYKIFMSTYGLDARNLWTKTDTHT